VSPKDLSRIELGDWQTPESLAKDVVARLSVDLTPAAVLEPTCGIGTFLRAAGAAFPEAALVGFDLSSKYVRSARKSLGARESDVRVADFFETDWAKVVHALPEPLLVLGNPPWVTSSTQGALGGKNLPEKTNRDKLRGVEAVTGKSNFDVSEWMIVTLLDALVAAKKTFTLAMLCKTHVARRVLGHALAKRAHVSARLYQIDARRAFGAAVEAVLLTLASSKRVPSRVPVHESLERTKPSRTLGVVDGRLSADIEAFEATRWLEGPSTHVWRSGLKHDCAKIMELTETPRGLENGLGERVSLEETYLYPLLKSSDVANGRLAPRRRVLVTQRSLGEDPSKLREAAPKTFAYLEAHRAHLDARKSRIYRGRPPYSIFGVGPYSFAPYKVALSGLYKRLAFQVVAPHEGRPQMLDDTVTFLPCATEAEARALHHALESELAARFFGARVFWDEKRPLGKALLETLSLDRLLAAVAGDPTTKAKRRSRAT
jgi:hypothetical protein